MRQQRTYRGNPSSPLSEIDFIGKDMLVTLRSDGHEVKVHEVPCFLPRRYPDISNPHVPPNAPSTLSKTYFP